MKCQECNEEFLPLHGGHVLCGEVCRRQRSQRLEKLRTVTRREQRQQQQLEKSKLRGCVVCNTSLSGRRLDSLYCGKKCWTADNPELIKSHALNYRAANAPLCRQRHKLWRAENAELLSQKRKEKRTNRDAETAEAEAAYQNSYSQTNRERLVAYRRAYYREHRDRISAARKLRRSRDREFALLANLRSYLSTTIKHGRGIKNKKTIELLGCTIAEFRTYLERQFAATMTWANYGSYWHIDHIRPCASFDHSSEEEVKKCWHYSNMRPLEASQNLADGARGFRKDNGCRPPLPRR